MIQLRQIDTSDNAYRFVEQLFLSAFPEDERRDVAAQRYNTDSNPLFHCMLAEEMETYIGFFTYWDFGHFCYGEHFATDPTRRNLGYGSQILQSILTLLEKPLVIEVEMPDNELSMRRIAFYRRNGMLLWEGYNYTQPAYRPLGNTLPMLLMSSRGLNPKTDFDDVVSNIYRQAYGVGE